MRLFFLLFLSLFLFSCSGSSDFVDENKNIWSFYEESKVILSIWDSLTAWYWLDEEFSYPSQLQSILNTNWYNYEIINAWISWETSSQLKSRMKLYESKKPEIVILVTWWNDWLRALSVETLENNLVEIIEYFNSIWSKVVVWWMDIPANLWRAYRDDFVWVYTRLRDREDIYLIDFFLELVAWNSRYNLPDQIHPNKDWYEIIAINVYEFLKSNWLLN